MSELIHFTGKTRKAFKEGKGVINIAGKDIAEADLKTQIQKARKEGHDRKEHERPKTMEEIHYFGLLSAFFNSDRKRLGLPVYVGELERVHLLDSNKVKAGETPIQGRGWYDVMNDCTYSQQPVDDKVSEYAYFATTGHEESYRASGLGADPLHGNLVRQLSWLDRKTGLGYGMCEALTEINYQRFVQANMDELFQFGGVMKEGKKHLPWNEFRAYQLETRVAKHIAGLLNKRHNRKPGSTMENFLQYHYTANQDYLVEIAKLMTEEEFIMMMLLSCPASFNPEKTKSVFGEIEGNKMNLPMTIRNVTYGYWFSDEKPDVSKITSALNDGVLDTLKEIYYRK